MAPEQLTSYYFRWMDGGGLRKKGDASVHSLLLDFQEKNPIRAQSSYQITSCLDLRKENSLLPARRLLGIPHGRRLIPNFKLGDVDRVIDGRVYRGELPRGVVHVQADRDRIKSFQSLHKSRQILCGNIKITEPGNVHLLDRSRQSFQDSQQSGRRRRRQCLKAMQRGQRDQGIQCLVRVRKIRVKENPHTCQCRARSGRIFGFRDPPALRNRTTGAKRSRGSDMFSSDWSRRSAIQAA